MNVEQTERFWAEREPRYPLELAGALRDFGREAHTRGELVLCGTLRTAAERLDGPAERRRLEQLSQLRAQLETAEAERERLANLPELLPYWARELERQIAAAEGRPYDPADGERLAREALEAHAREARPAAPSRTAGRLVDIAADARQIAARAEALAARVGASGELGPLEAAELRALQNYAGAIDEAADALRLEVQAREGESS